MEPKKLNPGDDANSQILLYQSVDGQTKIEVKLENETVWLTQKQMADLFQKSAPTINEHIKNIFEEGELEADSTIRNFRIVQKEGDREVKREVDHYSLDMIISVGYRVNSYRGTQFRIWATQRLKEYLVKGFTMDDQRLAEGKSTTGVNYFQELLERVRAIRASERNLYQKVTDIFATSIDYNSNTDQAKQFFATIQNKFHYAITGHTAAELIVNRVDGSKEHMGLTQWKGQDITAPEAIVAKNYMVEKELKQLFLLVEQFLSFAELQISLERPMYMADWKERLDEFLKLNRLKVLKDSGKVPHKKMEEVVKRELKKYHKNHELNQPKAKKLK